MPIINVTLDVPEDNCLKCPCVDFYCGQLKCGFFNRFLDGQGWGLDYKWPRLKQCRDAEAK